MLSICGMRDARGALIQKGAHGRHVFQPKGHQAPSSLPDQSRNLSVVARGESAWADLQYCGGPQLRAPESEWGFLLGVDLGHLAGHLELASGLR